MVAPIIIGVAAVIGGFVLLRILMGMGGSSSYSTRHSSAEEAKSTIARTEAYESQINQLQRIVRAAPNDMQRELAAKRLERLLKNKERLKVRAERLTKKA